MKSNFKIALGAAALIAAFNINATQRDITVTADVDASVDLTRADGSALPTTVAMQYLPAAKVLSPYKENIKFWSNSENKDLNISLFSSPSLSNFDSSMSIPLSVSINGKVLSSTATAFTYADTFPNGIANGSSVRELAIYQTSAKDGITSGRYSGIVTLVVTQAP